MSPQSKTALVDVVKEVAAKLGNKPASCKKYYIHPNVLECYASGRLSKIAKTFHHRHHGYDYERLVLSLLPSLAKRRAA
jgi:DNA topoisomerase-1